MTVSDTAAEGRAVEDYELSEEEAGLLYRAEQHLVALCMREAGQPYEEMEPPQRKPLEEHWSWLGRTDRALAGEHGYVVLATHEPGGINPPRSRLRSDAERDAWSRAFNGEPWSSTGGPTGLRFASSTRGLATRAATSGRQAAGGCFGQMSRELYGDQSRHTSLSTFVSNTLRAEVDRRVQADPRLQRAERAWSSCMRDRGHDFEDPLDPVQQFQHQDTGVPRPTDRERAVAVDDVRCKEESGLVRAYGEVKTQHSRAVAAENTQYLSVYRTMVDRATQRARAVVGE